MSKTNQYYLIARDRLTNEYQVVSIDGRRSFSLEELDLYTTHFENESVLERGLNKIHAISLSNVDFFIAGQSKVNGKKVLKKMEVLYQNNDSIREIAKNSKNKNIEASMPQIDRILDQFADKMARSPILYEQVVSGKTNIYDKYANYFIFTRRNLASIKYRDGGWARTSYPLVRNILEATSRHNTRYARMSDQMYRGLLDEKLLRETDPDYDPNQLSFLDDIIENPVDEEKLLSVMSSFEKLPAATILIDNNHAFFNATTFLNYEEGDLEKFQTYLPENLRLILRLFMVQRDALETAPERMGEAYQRPVQKGQRDMIDIFKIHPEILDRAYAWCQLFDTYKEKTLGDVNGREYQKRRED